MGCANRTIPGLAEWFLQTQMKYAWNSKKINPSHVVVAVGCWLLAVLGSSFSRPSWAVGCCSWLTTLAGWVLAFSLYTLHSRLQPLRLFSRDRMTTTVIVLCL